MGGGYPISGLGGGSSPSRSGWWGRVTSSQVWGGGGTPSRSGWWGVPHPKSGTGGTPARLNGGGGVPWPGLDDGREYRRYPPARSGWWGYPIPGEVPQPGFDDGGYPLARSGWWGGSWVTPHIKTWPGYPPP